MCLHDTVQNLVAEIILHYDSLIHPKARQRLYEEFEKIKKESYDLGKQEGIRLKENESNIRI